MTVLSVGGLQVDVPNFIQRGGVSLQIRILKFKDGDSLQGLFRTLSGLAFLDNNLGPQRKY